MSKIDRAGVRPQMLRGHLQKSGKGRCHCPLKRDLKREFRKRKTRHGHTPGGNERTTNKKRLDL